MHPKRPELHQLKKLAQLAYDEDRLASVVELLSPYLQLEPEDSKAWFLYGDALRVIGKKGVAAVALANAERLCPPQHKWTVQEHLGLLFYDKGDYASAERWFSRALESEEAQACSWLWNFRGANFAVQELLEEAEQCYRRAIAVNGNDEEAFLNLGMVLRTTGNYAEAIRSVETALTICPAYPSAIELLKSLDGVDESRHLVARLTGTQLE